MESAKNTVVERVVCWRSSSRFVKLLRRQFDLQFSSTAKYHTH